MLRAMVPRYVLLLVDTTMPVAEPLTTLEPMKQMFSSSTMLRPRLSPPLASALFSIASDSPVSVP